MAEHEAQRYERLKDAIGDYMEIGGGADVLLDDLRAIVQELRNYPDKLAMWFDQLEDLLK